MSGEFTPSGKVVIFGEGVDRLRRGERNVYLKWLRRREGAVEPGDLVEVVDDSGEFLAWGFYEGIGAMAVRVLSLDREDRPSEDWLRSALERALRFRERLNLGDFFRLVHSEADGLPGLIVDVYSSLGVVTSTSVGMDRRLGSIAEILAELLGLDAVYARNDARTRREVGLPTWRGRLIGEAGPTARIEEGGVRFEVDVIRGQKTGFFIDQRENRLLLQRYAPRGGRVLDLFSYTGGFGLHALAGGAAEAVLVDESDYAVEAAMRNAELNGLSGRVSAVRSRVKEFLESARERGDRYDAVVVDPPALVPSRERLSMGLKTYVAVNTAAMEVLEPGGLMISTSCSQFVDAGRLRRVLLTAASKAKRRVRFLGGVLGQSPDHPVDPLHPWTGYLKGFALVVE
ncbi:MAG: class I SAM-dependent rRNA methyltransferase [Candidatus Korarchaeota archaeon]|nr:class I SAM-dependent rRNA methyltransferase [Candidatus Korarchaeota archaeon]